MEDENDNDSMSAAKYNECWRQVRVYKEEVEHCQVEEQWRVEAERCRAEEQAKRWVSYSWLVMTELMVLCRGGHCTTVQQRQKEGIRATGVQLVCGVWAQVQTWAW